MKGVDSGGEGGTIGAGCSKEEREEVEKLHRVSPWGEERRWKGAQVKVQYAALQRFSR